MPDSNPAPTVADPAPATGLVWAAMLAAGFGCATLGVLTVLTEVSKPISHALTLFKSVGDLSGVSTLSLLVWIVSWFSLSRLWKRRSIFASGLVLAISMLLVLIGLLGTFPPVADWTTGK